MNKRKKKIFKKRENPKSSKFPQHRKWIAIDHEKNTQNGRKRVPMKEQGSKWGRRNIREMGGFGGFKGRLWRAKISLDALNFVTQHTLANKISKCRKIYQFLSMLVNLVDIVHEILCSQRDISSNHGKPNIDSHLYYISIYRITNYRKIQNMSIVVY